MPNGALIARAWIAIGVLIPNHTSGVSTKAMSGPATAVTASASVPLQPSALMTSTAYFMPTVKMLTPLGSTVERLVGVVTLVFIAFSGEEEGMLGGIFRHLYSLDTARIARVFPNAVPIDLGLV